MNIVLDTNVLVSALLSSNGKPAAVLTAVFAGRFTPCYDYRMIEEYYQVLYRPKFCFANWAIESLLSAIMKEGLSVIPEPLDDVLFVDKSDKKFYEVAKYCQALLVTGNIKHYPEEPCIISVSDFFAKYCNN